MGRGNVKPDAANDLSRLIARVENLERIFKPGGPDSLEALTDVDITNPLANDVLTYVPATGKWQNAPGGGAGAYPLGPFDDGNAVNEIQVITISTLSEQRLSTVSDADASILAGLATAVDNASGGSALQLVTQRPSGQQAIVGLSATSTESVVRLATEGFTGTPFPEITLTSASGGSVIEIGNAALITIAPLTLSSKLAFFSAAGSTQVATPVTLADVIALLQAYGLAA